MTVKALVEGARVAQIVAVGQDFPVAPPLQWVDAPDTTTTEHTYNGATFVPPPAKTIDKRLEPADLATLLVSKGVLSQAEVDAVKR